MPTEVWLPRVWRAGEFASIRVHSWLSMKSAFQWGTRIAGGLASRWRNLWYRALGVRIEGYCWLRRIEIARNWHDITLEADVALDMGVVLITGGPPRVDKIRIGTGTYVNRYTIFDGHERLHVGRRCMIGPHCYITDADHRKRLGLTVQEQPMKSAPVIIEDGAWLGAHVIVLPGVRIGRGAVIAAGSVVNKDIPDNAIAAGMPARVVRMRTADQD